MLVWMPHSDVDAPGLGEAKPDFTPRECDQLCECPALYKTRPACGVRHKGDGGALPGWEQHWQSTEQNSQIEHWHRLPREGKKVLQAGMKIKRNIGWVSKATSHWVKLQDCFTKESICGKVGLSTAEQVNQVSELNQIPTLPPHCLHFLFILFQVKGLED